MNYPIFSIDDVVRIEHAGVIVALPENNAKTAIRDIARRIGVDNVYFSADLDPVICHELGYRL